MKSAASDAISRIKNAGADNVGYANATPGDLFYALGERFYYDSAAIKADPRHPLSYIWYWSDDKGLTKIDVPNPIFSDIMSMRSAEYALTLGTSQEAQSLWLVANYKREVDLPDGQKDATRADNQPSAHFYGVDSGARFFEYGISANASRPQRGGCAQGDQIPPGNRRRNLALCQMAKDRWSMRCPIRIGLFDLKVLSRWRARFRPHRSKGRSGSSPFSPKRWLRRARFPSCC